MTMRKVWMTLGALLMLFSAQALAEGGKVRGDNGQGSVVQVQVRAADPQYAPDMTSGTTTMQPVQDSQTEPGSILEEYEGLEGWL